MNATEIIEKLAARQAGGIASVVVNRPGKVRKALAGEAGDIRKVSKFPLQLASYGKRGPVREAVANEEREAPKTPAWVGKVERQPNGLTFWTHATKGTQYLALPRFGDSAQVEWTRDGEPVKVEEIAHFLLASETAKRPSKAETEEKGQAQFVAIGLDNVAEIA